MTKPSEIIVKTMTATLLLSAIATSGCSPNVRDGNGRPIDRRAEREAQALDMQAVEAEEPMADGGRTAVQAEKTGAALDREADAVTAAGEREAAARRSR